MGRGLLIFLAACSSAPRTPAPEPVIPGRDAAAMVGGFFRFKFKPDKVGDARAYFAGQMARVERDEPQTLALVWFTMAADPSEVAIFEVYADRPALDAHNGKPEMAELKTKIPELTDLPTLKAVSFAEPGIGFVRVGGDRIPYGTLAGTVREVAAAPDVEAKLKSVTGAEQTSAPDVLVDVYFHAKGEPNRIIGLEIFRDVKARDAHGAGDATLGGTPEPTGPAFLGFVR